MTTDPMQKNSSYKPKGALYVPGMEETPGPLTREHSMFGGQHHGQGHLGGIIN